MSSARLRVAMLGAGSIAGYHLAGLAATGRAEVRVVTGRTLDATRAIAERFGIAQWSCDIEAVLARDDIDAVIIATPDATHEAIAIAAAAAHKSILLQKPMAGSVAAAQRIIAAAVHYGVDLQVSFMHRFFDEVIETRRWLDDDVIGRPFAARIRNATPGPDWSDWFFRKQAVPNGVIDQLGVHGIDLVMHLLGPVERVGARARIAVPSRMLNDGRFVDVETVDNAVAVYELAGGMMVTHEMSQTEVAGCDRFRLEIYGERGTLWLRTERGRLAAFVPDRFGCEWHAPVLVESATGENLHDAWIDGITGAAQPLATATDALSGMRVVESIACSLERDGANVDVAECERAPA